MRKKISYPFVEQHDSTDCGAACLSMICEYYGLKIPLSTARSLIKVDSNGANILGIIEGAKQLGMIGDALEGTIDELQTELKNNDIVLPIIARIESKGLEHFVVIYKYTNNTFTIGDPSKGIIKLSGEEFYRHWSGHIITFKVTESFKKENKRRGTLSKFFAILLKKKKVLISLYIFSVISIIISLISAFLFGYIVFYAVSENANHEVQIEETNIIIENETDADSESDEEDHQGHSEGLSVPEYILFLVEKAVSKEKLESITEVIDRFISDSNTAVSAIIVAYLVQLLIIIIRNYWVARLSKEIEVPIVTEYFEHLVDLPMESLSSRKTGELISRFSDADRIRDAISKATITLLLDTLIVIFGSAALWSINHKLFFIACVVITAYIIIIFAFLTPVKKINRAYMASNAQMTSYVKESISGIETIKAFSYEAKTKQEAKKLYLELANQAFKGQIIYGIQDSLSGTVANMGIVTILWIGSTFIAGNTLTVSTLFTFYYLFDFFVEPVKNIVELQPTLQTASIAAERLNDIIGVQVEKRCSGYREFVSGDITLENVSFRYGYRDLVLNNISICIPYGKKTAIVGRSGSGKTTLAKLLLGFYIPEAGKITIGGVDINSMNIADIRENIAYVSQDVFFFSDSIINNLRFGKEIEYNEIERVCKHLGIHDFIENTPFGYNTVIEEGGLNLSGGQRQRLGLARALLSKPHIIILDEATSNLDSISESDVLKAIDTLSQNITFIIIAHKLKTIKNCDEIIVLDKGKIVEHGTHSKLVEQQGIYTELYLHFSDL
jgi:ATP-binding cassette subfamily B protein